MFTLKAKLKRKITDLEEKISELEIRNSALRDVNRDCRRQIEKLKDSYILKNNELVMLRVKGEKKMTNFEYYKDEILAIDGAIALKDGEPVSCYELSCNGCDFIREGYCINSLIKWLYEEHVEKPKLTKREILFCELMKNGWICRDIGGGVYYHNFKPVKGSSYWGSNNGLKLNDFRFQLDFNFIKWEDEEPWSVQELLKLEVEE